MMSVKTELVKVIVSESGENAANVVYKGRFENPQWIAIKKFTKVAWPDPEQFKEEAQGVGKLRHKRLANLMGYCCAGDERLLVAEYMPNDTLAKHLSNWEKQSIDWPLRLRVAFYLAQALDCRNTEDRPLYKDLNAYRFLLDEDGDHGLSSLGTHLAYTPPQYQKNGRVSRESVIYSFSSILLDLPSGKHIPPSHLFDMIRGENLNLLMDSHLEGNFSTEEASEFTNVNIMASPTIYAPHIPCNLFSDRSDAALLDTMEAFYMLSVVISKLDMLHECAALEEKRQ